MDAEPQANQRIARLTALDAVLARIDARVMPVAAREVALAAAVGRTLADDVILPARPAVALALRDGWALDSALTRDASAYAPALLPLAIRIDAGAPLPGGTDAVAEIDAVVLRDGRAEAIEPITAGEGVLPPGADADGRTVLLPAGRCLHAAAAGALAAAQVARIWVREPRVRVARARGGDPILDAAAQWVARAIEAGGGAALVDPSERLEDALRRADADAVLVIGGTGNGRDDASVATLARLGEVEAHGIALSPGETAAFGLFGTCPVLLLPGRLDAALAVFMLLGSRILAQLAARREEPGGVSARLVRKVSSNLGLAELVPVRWRNGEVEPLAAGYLSLQAIARSDGWILVAAEREGYPAGASVMVRSWP
ncbi:MAG TPA: molybdopterin-binding protein [Xanthobacteraceae bacterium]